MSIVGNLVRLTRVAATFRRTGALSFALEAADAPEWFKTGAWLLTAPLWPFGARGDAGLPPLSRAISALGPAYVKFGQVLSTRPDIAGETVTQDLRFLQDRLPPFSTEEARQTVERELGKPVGALFRRFDPPIAAASIAQVHPAETFDGRKVAVKVLRPRIERGFARDIAAFYFTARLMESVLPKSRRLRPQEVVKHFEGVVTREMDLRLEAAAGSEYGEIIAQEDGFRAPGILWPLSAKRVLTTDWADGDRMGDLAALKARDLDLPELAQRLVRLFLRTGLRDGYFHADMHQGNLKVAADGAVVIYDFGIMGRIDRLTRRTYAEILFAYLSRDYYRGAQAHFDAGYVPRHQNIDQFAQALRSIGEPIVGQQAAEISMAKVLQQLFDVTEQFGMETRPELILLQRTMVVVEGVARSLDPNFNMWETARPEVERFMAENLGPAGAARDAGDGLLRLARLGPRLPEIAERVVELTELWAQERGAPIAPPPPAPAPEPSDRFWRGIAFGAAAGAGAAYLFASASGIL